MNLENYSREEIIDLIRKNALRREELISKRLDQMEVGTEKYVKLKKIKWTLEVLRIADAYDVLWDSYLEYPEIYKDEPYNDHIDLYVSDDVDKKSIDKVRSFNFLSDDTKELLVRMDTLNKSIDKILRTFPDKEEPIPTALSDYQKHLDDFLTYYIDLVKESELADDITGKEKKKMLDKLLNKEMLKFLSFFN
jgi:hypothetical protein